MIPKGTSKPTSLVNKNIIAASNNDINTVNKTIPTNTANIIFNIFI